MNMLQYKIWYSHYNSIRPNRAIQFPHPYHQYQKQLFVTYLVLTVLIGSIREIVAAKHKNYYTQSRYKIRMLFHVALLFFYVLIKIQI